MYMNSLKLHVLYQLYYIVHIQLYHSVHVCYTCACIYMHRPMYIICVQCMCESYMYNAAIQYMCLCSCHGNTMNTSLGIQLAHSHAQPVHF